MKYVTPLALAVLVGLSAMAHADELRGTVDSVDTQARTITLGGTTIDVPQGMNLEGIMPGSGYDVIFANEGDRNVLQEITSTATDPSPQGRFHDQRSGGEGHRR